MLVTINKHLTYEAGEFCEIKVFFSTTYSPLSFPINTFSNILVQLLVPRFSAIVKFLSTARLVLRLHGLFLILKIDSTEVA